MPIAKPGEFVLGKSGGFIEFDDGGFMRLPADSEKDRFACYLYRVGVDARKWQEGIMQNALPSTLKVEVIDGVPIASGEVSLAVGARFRFGQVFKQ